MSDAWLTFTIGGVSFDVLPRYGYGTVVAYWRFCPDGVPVYTLHIGVRFWRAYSRRDMLAVLTPQCDTASQEEHVYDGMYSRTMSLPFLFLWLKLT